MAMVMDQQQQPQAYKHYCRVCKKGFGYGRAPGGHMRAHGINDEPAGGPDDDDNASGCSEPSQPPNNKRMYARFRSCESCGGQFVSWKSFLEQGKCSSDHDEEDGDDDGSIDHDCGWSKGKRSRRSKSSVVPASTCPSSEEEEDLANCLVMLSSARVAEPEEYSCASASKEEARRHHPVPAAAPAVPRGTFECKACKKVFGSHQALGGHRASHKKVKGCFAAANPNDDNDLHEPMAVAIVPLDNTPPIAVTPLKRKSKVHECSICRRQFSSGQALGGHKRCHWITSSSPDPTPVPKLQKVHHHQELSTLGIDLNMPAAPVDVPAAMCLQPWAYGDHKNKPTTSSNNNNDNYNDEGASSMNVDDGVDSKVKLAKLSELKGANVGGEASPWLQVGIGSSGE